MAKYKHHPDTLTVLEDILNRLQQLREAGQQYKHVERELVQHQDMAFASAQELVRQAIDSGHVFRGSWAVPDALLEYNLKTKSPETTLNGSKRPE